MFLARAVVTPITAAARTSAFSTAAAVARAAPSDGGIPSIMDAATGKEYAELHEGEQHQELAQKVLASQAATHWGTPEDPVLILSAVDHRIVGCTGEKCDSIHENGVLWWKLDQGPIHECPCGQAFQLVDRPHGLDQH